MKAWNAHQNKSSGTPYNVEGGFDVLDKFKADQKEGFRQAAPIIYDLVMDVVRSTGGEIPYAMYVISEDGYMAYLGGRVQDVVNDAKATAQFAREHPLQAGGMAVIAIAANGKILRAKARNKKIDPLRKANPAKGKSSSSVNLQNSTVSTSNAHEGHASTQGGIRKPTDIRNEIDDLVDELNLTHQTGRGAAIDFAESRGRLNGLLWGENRIPTLKKYLEKRGVNVRLNQEHVLAKLAKQNGLDGADAAFIIKKDGQVFLLLSSNPTRREVLHELSHFLHRQKIGGPAYAKLSRAEKEVWASNHLKNSNNWQDFNPEEQFKEISNLLKYSEELK